MFKLFITLSMFISLNVFAGTEIRNGGAGLKVDGGVATFFTAKVKVRPTALKDIPGLNELKKEVKNLVIDPKEKMNLFNAINPSFTRNYYQTNANSEDPEVQKIIRDYKSVIGLENEDLTIFAITNTTTQTTILLPDFFMLSTTEQTAILFHEALWFNEKITGLQQVLVLEYNFQKFLEKRDAESTYDFYEALSITYKQENWLFYASLKKELEDYALKNPSEKYIKVSNLFNKTASKSLVAYINATGTTSKMSAVANFQLDSFEELENPSPLFYTKKALFLFLNNNIPYGNGYYSFLTPPLENILYCGDECENILQNGLIPLQNENNLRIPILNPANLERYFLFQF